MPGEHDGAYGVLVAFGQALLFEPLNLAVIFFPQFDFDLPHLRREIHEIWLVAGVTCQLAFGANRLNLVVFQRAVIIRTEDGELLPATITEVASRCRAGLR